MSLPLSSVLESSQLAGLADGAPSLINKASMLAHIMAALQEAAPGAGAQQLPGGVPPPGPPPPPSGQALQPPAGDMGFVSKAFWELGPVDPQAIS
jgi:hypothetical protein